MIGKEKCAACGFEGKFITVMDSEKDFGHVARPYAYLCKDGIKTGILKVCPKCRTAKAFIYEYQEQD